MKYLLLIILQLMLLMAEGHAQDRFPKPDFTSGYEYPEEYHHVPNELLWMTVDVVLLLALMIFVTWAIFKKRIRQPIIWVSVISVAYFGFYRKGCVCSVGAVQNVALALVDSSYVMPMSVLLFFMLPVIFAFLFGRVFCAGVCPLGALQELVNVKNYRISKAVSAVLEILPWLYLIFALLFAVTQSRFIICRFDPFVGIFRMGGDIALISFGVALLLISIFTGRPFCRFLCPYGALLSLFARVSIWKIELTKQTCINCELCHNACPVDAIRPPFDNKIKESRMHGVKRIIMYFVALPVIIISCSILTRHFSDNFSRVHKDVRLYEMVIQHQEEQNELISLELEAFYGLGMSLDEIEETFEIIRADFKFYSTVAGFFIGLVIGLSLISFSLKRTRKLYDIDHGACVDCGRCFSYCPQNINVVKI